MHMLLTTRKRVRVPPALSLAIEATIAQYITALPPLSSGSSLDYSPSSPLRSSSSAPSSPYSRTGTSSAPQEGVHAKARLTHHGELIEEMYDHLIEIPITRLETIKHELETLRARVVFAKQEIASL
ncbi:hypothetical protein Tco_0776970 [Tanacetum coccineum]